MKKIIFFSFTISLFLIGCNCDVQKNEAANVALIEKYIQSVENLEYESMESILDDSYMGHGPSFNDSINKTQTIANWKLNVTNLYKSIEYLKSRNAVVLVNDGSNKGDWVSNWAELKITYKGSDDSVIIWANTIYKIENGKIIKSYSFYNEADVLEQLGFSYY